IEAIVPNLALAVLTTGIMGFWAGLVWVVSLTLVGSEVTDDMRGRTFAFIYNLMRLVLLIMVAAAPAIAGVIGPHFITISGEQIRADGVTVTLFGAGILSAVLGLVCYRLMDDRPDVSLWADLAAALRRDRPQVGRGTIAGLFIVFEGGEGAGKSTQVRRLAEAIEALGHEVVVTFEPGATVTGKRLREVLLDRDTTLSPMAEAMLYAADRAQHVDSVIRPGIERGAVVISDRYVDSSIAYQAGGRGLPEDDVRRLSLIATGGLRPDLTILLDIPPEVGLTRLTGPADRIETETIQFHHRVRRTFLALAGHNRQRYLILDAQSSPERVHEVLMARVLQLLLTTDLPRENTRPPLAQASR
ncbi:MAG: dTMP kinase, partial [Frankiaceae bacterium]|nr:dTMP kinase [Frankiaceae bacterium]